MQNQNQHHHHHHHNHHSHHNHHGGRAQQHHGYEQQPTTHSGKGSPTCVVPPPNSLAVLCATCLKDGDLPCVYKDCPLIHKKGSNLKSICLDHLASQSGHNERKQCNRKYCTRLHVKIPESETFIKRIPELADHLRVMDRFCVAVDRRQSEADPTVVVVPVENVVFTSGIAKAVECFFQFSKRTPYVCYDFLERQCSYGNHCYGIHIRNFDIKGEPHYKMNIPMTLPYMGKEVLCESTRTNQKCENPKCTHAHSLEELSEPSFAVFNHTAANCSPNATILGQLEDGSVKRYSVADVFITQGAVKAIQEAGHSLAKPVTVCQDWAKYRQHKLSECDGLHVRRQAAKRGETRHHVTTEAPVTTHNSSQDDHRYSPVYPQTPQHLQFQSEHGISPVMSELSPLSPKDNIEYYGAVLSPQWTQSSDLFIPPPQQPSTMAPPGATVIASRTDMVQHFQQAQARTPSYRQEALKEVERHFSDMASLLTSAKERVLADLDETTDNRMRIINDVMRQLLATQPASLAEVSTDIVNAVSQKIRFQVPSTPDSLVGSAVQRDMILLPSISFTGVPLQREVVPVPHPAHMAQMPVQMSYIPVTYALNPQ